MIEPRPRAKPLPPTDYLSPCFEYQPEGALFWRRRPVDHFKTRRAEAIWNPNYAGKRAGGVMLNGYRLISLDGSRYLEHRIIYAIVNGPVAPVDCVDHIDHDHTNNRAENLRLCTHAQNLMNQPGRRAAGVLPKHVTWSRRERKFKVAMRAGGSVYHIGTYTTVEEADAAATAARTRLHGVFSNDRRHA